MTRQRRLPVLLALFAGALCAHTLSWAAATPADRDTVVAVDGGRLRGAEAEGVASWKGIPFAAPPIGALRWRAPQPAAAWDGTRDATAYASDCMQLPFPSDAAPLGTRPAEDCLYANVWRPAAAARKLPVIVWIYGGGFVNGGASPPTYSGAALARQGIVFVSFNYRLGRFGTFAHPALTRADADGRLIGNYGYLDQIAALHWVRRNVAAFGGDPDNVTIIGESAGGMSVHMLLTSPMARGLFHKAAILSGGDGAGMGAADRAAVERVGAAFGEARGIAPDDPDAAAKLRALPADQIVDGLNLAALFKPGPRTHTGPFVDGRIAVDVPRAYASGAFAHVPVMIGATSGDLGGRAGVMVAGARRMAAAIADQGVPVFAYRFSYLAQSVATESGADRGAPHASDVPFFLGTQAIKYGADTTPRDDAVGRTIGDYLVRFARTGDPNGAGLPQWPRYTRTGDRIVDFSPDGAVRAEKDPLGAEIDAAGGR